MVRIHAQTAVRRDVRAKVLLFGFAAGAAVVAVQAMPGRADAEERPAGDAGPQPGAVAAQSLPPPRARVAHDELAALKDAEKVQRDRAEREQAAREKEAARQRAAAEAERNRVYPPVTGVITSNYGPRWGTTHYGLDIANAVGTPVRAPMGGVVLEAGTASGFGLWVRIRHEDGTITVYGHINSYSVRAGQRVEAGDVIAEVGNRGISTGPHLHFEVWSADGRKVDPLAWLRARGADVTGR